MSDKPFHSGALSAKAKELLGSGDNQEIDYNDGCLEMLKVFDGWAGLAREVKYCYESMDATPTVKANLLKNVLGIFETQARINKDNRPSESTMTDEELLAQAQPIIRAIQCDTPRLEPPTPIEPLREDDFPAPAPQTSEPTAPAV